MLLAAADWSALAGGRLPWPRTPTRRGALSLRLASAWPRRQRCGQQRVRRDKTASRVQGERKWPGMAPGAFHSSEKKGLRQKRHMEDSG